MLVSSLIDIFLFLSSPREPADSRFALVSRPSSESNNVERAGCAACHSRHIQGPRTDSGRRQKLGSLYSNPPFLTRRARSVNARQQDSELNHPPDDHGNQCTCNANEIQANNPGVSASIAIQASLTSSSFQVKAASFDRREHDNKTNRLR